MEKISCFEAHPVDWWGSLIDTAAGEGSELRFGVITVGKERVQVEIIGSLPPVLRRGLKRAIPWWKPVRSRQVPWALFGITWCPDPAGFGPRYAIPSYDTLVGLLVARRKYLARCAA